MRYSKPIFVFCASLTLISALFNIPSIAKANPIVIGSTTGGGLFTISHNLSMPMANVNITIKSNKTNESIFYHQIEIQGDYQLQSEIIQNATIAFAYPKAWAMGEYWDTRVLECELNLTLEGDLLEYEIMTLWDLIDYYSWNDFIDILWQSVEDYEYYDYLEFALFNASFFDKKPMNLKLLGQIKIKSKADEFEFSYCVGSGRTWKGTVNETIHIELTNTNLFHNYSFIPDENLSISRSAQSAIATWSINPVQFEHNFVVANCVQLVFDPPDYVESTENASSNTLLFTIENTFVSILMAISFTLVMSIYILSQKKS